MRPLSVPTQMTDEQELDRRGMRTDSAKLCPPAYRSPKLTALGTKLVLHNAKPDTNHLTPLY